MSKIFDYQGDFSFYNDSEKTYLEISGYISRDKNGYFITATTQFGDIFSYHTNDPFWYDYAGVTDDFEEQCEYDIALYSLLDENPNHWKFKANLYAFPTNASLCWGSNRLELNFDGLHFDDEDEANDWIKEQLWGYKDQIANYDSIKDNLLIALNERID